MKRLSAIIVIASIFSLYFSSCYYDNEEVLYPVFGCDTVNVTYNNNISRIMTSYCTSCHSGPLPEGGVTLATYEDVVHFAPRITTAIKHTGNFPMPQNGGKLSDCLILQWDIWLSEQMPR